MKYLIPLLIPLLAGCEVYVATDPKDRVTVVLDVTDAEDGHQYARWAVRNISGSALSCSMVHSAGCSKCREENP